MGPSTIVFYSLLAFIICSCFGWKELLHAWFFWKIDYHIEQFFCRCLINETEFLCFTSTECAIATLRETLASRLQMSVGPSNSSRSSATPVIVREAAKSACTTTKKCVHNHQKVRAHTRPTKFDTVYAKNCRWNQHLARIGPRNSQTIGRNSGRTSYKLFNFWRLKISEYDWKDVDYTFVSSHLWTGREVCSRMKSFSPSNKPTIIRTTRAGASRLPTLNSAIVEHAKIQSP